MRSRGSGSGVVKICSSTHPWRHPHPTRKAVFVVIVMLTYASTAPRVQTLLRGPHPAVRCSSRRSGSSLSSLNSGFPGIVPVASFYPSPCASKVAPASSSTLSSRARLQMFQHGRIHRIDGSIPVGAWAFNIGPLVAAKASSRCLSSTTRRLVEGNQGRDREPNTTPSQTQPPPPRAPQQQQKQQQQLKGIRKVLPSLTPHENIYTVPNLLTFSRLAAAPFIGYAILHDAHALALALFAYAGVSDLLDGWIARRWNLQTVVGSVVDPMADKMLMTVLTVCLAMKGALPGRFFFFVMLYSIWFNFSFPVPPPPNLFLIYL